MNQRIKAPSTVQELGHLADELGMGAPELLQLLEDLGGLKWWALDKEITVNTVRANDRLDAQTTITLTPRPRAVGKPAGYLREKGRKGTRARKGRFIGDERVGRGWIITPTWNAESNQHAIELWSPQDAKLTPAEARKFAVTLLETADAVEVASTTMEG